MKNKLWTISFTQRLTCQAILLGKDYAFTWIYNTLMLEVDYTLWTKLGNFQAHICKVLCNSDLA
jgi:hypothetical protein